MKLTNADRSALLVSGSNRLTVPDWKDVVAWDNSYDFADNTLYVPDGATLAEYALSGATRIGSVFDRGSSPKDMLKDNGVYATAYSAVNPFPGPLYIAGCHRFRNRPAAFFDRIRAYPQPGMYSMLTPNADHTNTADYFNPPSGYAAPYWIAVLARPIGTGTGMDAVFDCTLGSTAAGPTVAAGAQLGGGTAWSVACWTSLSPAGGIITSPHSASVNESVLIMVQVASGSNNSKMWVYWRGDGGTLTTDGGTAGTLNANALKEFMMGLTHSCYVSNVGVKQGTASLGDIAAVVSWATPWICSGALLPE